MADTLLSCLATRGSCEDSSKESQKREELHAPILDTSDFVWTEMDYTSREEIVEEFRQQVTGTLANIRELLDSSMMHALPGELHQLVGQARAIGALKLQSYARRCKSCFTSDHLQGIETLVYETLSAVGPCAPRPARRSKLCPTLHALPAASLSRLAASPSPSCVRCVLADAGGKRQLQLGARRLTA